MVGAQEQSCSRPAGDEELNPNSHLSGGVTVILSSNGTFLKLPGCLPSWLEDLHGQFFSFLLK